jgi:predicted DNA-binding transcriptional regulator YafY
LSGQLLSGGHLWYVSQTTHYFGSFRGDGCFDLVIRFDPEQSRWMREKSWPGETQRAEGADGSLTLTLQVTNLKGVLRWVMQYGSRAEVREPAELREMLREQVRAMEICYGRELEVARRR